MEILNRILYSRCIGSYRRPNVVYIMCKDICMRPRLQFSILIRWPYFNFAETLQKEKRKRNFILVASRSSAGALIGDTVN